MPTHALPSCEFQLSQGCLEDSDIGALRTWLARELFCTDAKNVGTMFQARGRTPEASLRMPAETPAGWLAEGVGVGS